jgi:prepilin-type processing-associated H-X9-DG protein
MALDDIKRCNGLCYQRSKIRLADVTDGTSNTYLLGEKYINPDDYFTGLSYCDDQPVLGSDDLDLLGWTNDLPYQDTSGYGNVTSFGSAHANSFNMAFCDGSVQSIGYAIDAAAHRYLGSRNDDQAIDAKKVL